MAFFAVVSHDLGLMEGVVGSLFVGGYISTNLCVIESLLIVLHVTFEDCSFVGFKAYPHSVLVEVSGLDRIY